MKHTLIVLCLTSLTWYQSHGQTEPAFIHGYEWLNHPFRLGEATNDPVDSNHIVWRRAADSLHLNWGMVRITGSDSANRTHAVLSAAASNGMRLNLSSDYFARQSGPAYGRRWEYQPEDPAHFPAFPGRTGGATNSTGGTTFPDDDTNVNNTWQADVNSHNQGWLTDTTILQPIDPHGDGVRYWMKIRMRLGSGMARDTKPVVTVQVKDSTSHRDTSRTILAQEFAPGVDFQEITVLSFVQSPTLHYASPNSGTTPPQLRFTDPMGLAGVPDHPRVMAEISPDDWRYRIWWHDSVTCEIDCVVLDDSLANLAFSGFDDAAIRSEVAAYVDDEGLGRFKVRDAPTPSEYLAVGYVEGIIASVANANGHAERTGVHFNTGHNYWGADNGPTLIHRNLVWTHNTQNLSDIYPLPLGFSMPGAADYSSAWQTQLQAELVRYLG
jgi:hypothetical protein